MYRGIDWTSGYRNVKFRNQESDQERKREKNIKMTNPEKRTQEDKDLTEDLALELMKTMNKGASLVGMHIRQEEKDQLNEYREWLDSIPDDSPEAKLHARHLTAFQLAFNIAERIALRAEMAKMLYLDSLKSENQKL